MTEETVSCGFSSDHHLMSLGWSKVTWNNSLCSAVETGDEVLLFALGGLVLAESGSVRHFERHGFALGIDWRIEHDLCAATLHAPRTIEQASRFQFRNELGKRH